MLTQLRIRNFKAWKDTGDIRLAPLTVLFGANSSGKSSLGHLLLALAHTAASADRRRALQTGDEGSLVDLGSFIDCLHGRDAAAELEFSLDWSLPGPLEVQNPLDPGEAYRGQGLRLVSTLAADAREQPVVRRLRYALHEGGAPVLTATLDRAQDGTLQLGAQPYRLVQAPGRGWPLEPAEKFYRISERSLARYRNADFLADFALHVERHLASLSYLGPLREYPRRVYGWSGNRPDGVGSKGEHAMAAILAAEAEGRAISRGAGQAPQPFAAFVAQWLEELGVIESFALRPTAAGRRAYEVKVKTRGGFAEVALPDVGFGVSQVLPALVQAFYCPAGSMVWLEQPELHLHPEVQAHLADVFICAVRAHEQGAPRNVQLIIETHSEHFLNRLQRRIAEERLAPEEVAIYFAQLGAQGAELEALRVNEYGDITNWPEHFFADEMNDIVARTQAAAARRSGAR